MSASERIVKLVQQTEISNVSRLISFGRSVLRCDADDSLVSRLYLCHRAVFPFVPRVRDPPEVDVAQDGINWREARSRL